MIEKLGQVVVEKNLLEEKQVKEEEEEEDEEREEVETRVGGERLDTEVVREKIIEKG